MTAWQVDPTVVAAFASVTIAAVAVVSLVRKVIQDFRRELEAKIGDVETRLRELETSMAGFRAATNVKLGQQGLANIAAKLEDAMKQGGSL